MELKRPDGGAGGKVKWSLNQWVSSTWGLDCSQYILSEPSHYFEKCKHKK